MSVSEATEAKENEAFTQAMTLLKAGKVQEAVEALEALVKDEPENLRALQQLSGLCLGMGDYEKARGFITQAAKVDDKHPVIANMQGVVEFHASNYEQAEAAYKHAVKLDEKDPNVWNNLGDTYREQGKWDEAEDAYKKALACDANHVAALGNYSTLCITLQRVDEAVELADKAMKVAPNVAASVKAKAAAHAANQDWEQTEALTGKILKAAPNFIEALVLHAMCKMGKREYEEAERLLDHALKVRPKMAEAIFRRSTLYNNQGKKELALEEAQRAAALKPFLPMGKLVLGNALRSVGKHKEAMAVYEEALELLPTYAEAHASRANLFADLRQFKEADEEIAKAIAIRPNHPQMLLSQAAIKLSMGDREASKNILNALIKKRGDFVQALILLSTILILDREFDAAFVHLKKALELQPNNPEAHLRMGNVYFEQRKFAPSSEHLAKALNYAPHMRTARVLFSECMRAVRLTHYTKEYDVAISTCLDDKQLSKQFLAGGWYAMLFQHPELVDVSNIIKAKNYDEAKKLLDESHTSEAFQHPYFVKGVREILAANIHYEWGICYLRRYALEHRDKVKGWGWTSLLQSLAYWAFVTEYIGWETEEETTQVETLVSSLDANSPLEDLLLAASYRPLANLGVAEAVSEALRATEDELNVGIAKLQIDDVLAERSMKPEIQTLGKVDDEVSQAVQGQYEENPYPRWNQVTLRPSVPLPNVVQTLFPHMRDEELASPNPLRVLIPGCGTGKQAVMCADRFANTDVLALDLSKSSLAYAIRQSKELGLDKNITFRQADLLKLHEIVDEKFDYIECTGVLHHMRDPMEGWKILCSLLKPDGFMKIGLYSETARQRVVRARDFIAEHGYEANLKGIRECRKAIHALPDKDSVREIENSRDYYITSECRDLIFHVQEHRFTIPQLKKCLEELEMEFVGFEGMNPALAKQYINEHPDDPGLSNLDDVEAFENRVKSVFFGMYQFWLRPKNRG